MWDAIVLGAAVVVTIGVAIGAAIVYATYSHEQESTQEDREPDLSSIRTLGPCSHCNGDVDALNGFEMPCEHFLHYTCAAILKNEFGSNFDLTMGCRVCLRTRLDPSRASASNSGLRNRTPNSLECANCRRKITAGESYRMASCEEHHIHETCWERMIETSTTCPGCMDL